MVLNKEHWSKEDIPEFERYLYSLSEGEEKSFREQKITRTSLPCLAVPSKEVQKICREIAKGNFLEFIDLWIWNNLTEGLILGKLICKIKDFEIMKSYLVKYSKQADCWACTDTIKIKVKDIDGYLNFAEELTKSKAVFSRRLGVILMIKCINENSIDRILYNLNQFKNEKEYYVNMALAWLLAECFTKQREKTLIFLDNNHLNEFVINKGISKCRDSFRISSQDKQMLLKYKK